LDLESLDLSHNQLRDIELYDLKALRTVDLSHNQLKYMHFLSLPNITEVFLSNNQILKLTNNTFVNCSRLLVIFFTTKRHSIDRLQHFSLITPLINTRSHI